MASNLEKYKGDLDRLISEGETLLHSIQKECYPEEFKQQILTVVKDPKNGQKFFDDIPDFNSRYQLWYSQSLSLIKVVLPDRLDDFIKLYKKPKSRKSIGYENYVLADYMQSLMVTQASGETKVDKTAAIPQYQHQLDILKSVLGRFDSSLFDIKQLLQADLFDSELDAARELLKNKFDRAAGAMAGVILEKHLAQVSENHSLKLIKKDPTVSDLNDLLKQANIIDVPTWRFIQRLGDLRNLCDHNKKKEPTNEDIKDLIEGVDKISKTVF